MKKLILLLLFIGVANGYNIQIEKLNNTDKVKIIGCISQNTLETRKPNNNGNCFYGYGWQNIMLPPKSHWKYRKDVFQSDLQILNRLAIVNFESGFNKDASNKWAIGYVQTLRRYNISTSIKLQLEWMYTRQESQKIGNCSQWWKYGSDRVVRCLYARHLGVTNGRHRYPNKLMKVRQYYIDYYNNFNL